MKTPTLLTAAVIAVLVCAPAQARLGESEDQSTIRDGAPIPEQNDRPGGPRRPLLEGAKELTYNFQGWHIRTAIVNKVTVRIEYSKPDGGGAMTEKQVEAILDAEKGNLRWKEVKEDDNDRRGRRGFGGRGPQRVEQWTRTDKATARLTERGSAIVIEYAPVAEKEKKSAAAVPKF